MLAALEAPTEDAALRAVGATPGHPVLSTPGQDAENRATMAKLREAAKHERTTRRTRQPIWATLSVRAGP